MNTKVFVANLPYSVADDALAEFFTQAGEVESAQVILDRNTGRSKGFGFVKMKTEEAAQRAIEELNGQQMNGREIVVNEAKPEVRNSDSRPAAPRANDFIKQIQDFCLNNPQVGDELAFVVNDRHFTLVRD